MATMDHQWQWQQWIVNGDNGLPMTTIDRQWRQWRYIDYPLVPANYNPNPTINRHLRRWRQWISIIAIGDLLSPLTIHRRHWRFIVAIIAVGDPLSPLAPLAPVGDVKYSIGIYFCHLNDVNGVKQRSPLSPMATVAIGCTIGDNGCNIAIDAIGDNCENESPIATMNRHWRQ